MNNKLKILIGIVGVILLATVMTLFITGIVKVKITKNISNNEIQCTELGGIFYQGKWGADNCVFPPKDTNHE